MTNDYLRDLDDWDEQSQQILLSLAKNNEFISFEEMKKGVFGKDKEQFEKIKIDRKIKRGETHRGLTNVHPFATQYRDNLDSNQIDHRYFVDATKTTYNNVSIITDVDTDNQALEIIKKEFYIDNNLNGKADAGEYVFHLIIFQSTDGNKIIEAYQASSQPNSNEIVLYQEQGQDVFSSQKIYAKVGEGIWEKVLSKENVYKNTLWKVLNEHLKFSDKELIFELLEKGKIEGSVIISTFLKGINITLQVLSAPAFAVGWLIEKIGEGLDFLKLPSTIWDVNGEGYFFEKDKLLQKLTISPEKINQLQKTILEDKTYQTFLPDMIELILDGMMNKLKDTVTNYNKWVTNKVTEISEAMTKNPEIQNELLYDIALLCGIWDGIVDTFSSAVLFTGQVAQSAFKAATNIDELLETIDNIFDFLTSSKVWESISSFFIKMREELSDIDLADIDLVKVSYILGFGIVFIAGAFIPLTALGKVGKIGSLGAKFSEMLTEVGKAVKTFPEAMKSKTVVQQINRLLDVFSSSEKTRNHAQEIAQAIKKWLVKNKEAFKNKLVLVVDVREFLKIYTLTTAQHINYGHVRVKKINPKLPKTDPKRIIEEYKYTPKRGKKGGGKFNYQIIVGGMHNLNNLNKYVRLKGELKLLGKLPTGEKVYEGMIEFYISELKQWSKAKKSTFFPKKWSESKIRAVIQDASMNIIYRDRNRYIGKTKNGIQIEFRLNLDTREIETAFITFEKI